MSSPVYSYITSLSRIFKSQVINADIIFELLNEKDWKGVVALLKNKGIINEEPKSILEAERIIKKRAINILNKLLGYSKSSKIVEDIIKTYIYFLNLDDLKFLVSIIFNSKFEIINNVELSRYLESQPKTIDELNASLRNTIYGEGLNFAILKGAKELPSLLSLLDYYFIYKLSKIVQEFKGDWRAMAEQLLCGYKDYYTLLLAFYYKLQFDTLCKLSSDVLRELLATNRIGELIDVLRRTQYSQYLDFSDPYLTLSSMYRYSRLIARKNALATFMGSPFTPLTALGISELIKLDTEDLITIINGVKVGMNQDKIRKMLSIP
jgi:hypothetical protein